MWKFPWFLVPMEHPRISSVFNDFATKFGSYLAGGKTHGLLPSTGPIVMISIFLVSSLTMYVGSIGLINLVDLKSTFVTSL